MAEPNDEINLFSKISIAINEYTDLNGCRPAQIILSELTYAELFKMSFVSGKHPLILGIYAFVDYNSSAKPVVLCKEVPKGNEDIIYYHRCSHCGNLFNHIMWSIAAKHTDCPSCQKVKISEYKPVR